MLAVHCVEQANSAVGCDGIAQNPKTTRSVLGEGDASFSSEKGTAGQEFRCLLIH